MTSPAEKGNFLLNRLAHFYAARKALILLMLVLFISLALIGVNYYTIRVTSAVRAYINGESEFSKSQKDAFLYLSNYIQTQDEHYRALYKDEISVPKGDNYARVTLMNGGPMDEIKKGFLAGRNNPADLNSMIWLYRNFKTVSFMQTAVKVWEEAEPLINEADIIDFEAYMQIKSKAITPEKKQAYITTINNITAELSKKERIFSGVLSDAARRSDTYLFWINVFFIVAMLGGFARFATGMVNKISHSAKALKTKIIELENLSKDLDTFVYSASHDLRTPIASLKGLVKITLEEDEPATREKYLKLMDGMADKLDIFIKEIIDFFKNKRTDARNEEVGLERLVDEAIGLVQFIPGNNISISKHINVASMYIDELRLKIILNNLISNAVKYCDLNKQDRLIKISASCVDGRCIIKVEDNGIGINREHHEKIFEMFFVSYKSKGTGLGLYIVKEIVDKLQGFITVESEVNKGSIFTVNLPYRPVETS